MSKTRHRIVIEHHLKEDLNRLRLQRSELIHIRSHLRWVKLFCNLEHMPLLIQVGTLHTFIMILHTLLFQHPDGVGRPLLRAGVWAASLVIVLSTVYLIKNISILVRRPRFHWIHSSQSSSHSATD